MPKGGKKGKVSKAVKSFVHSAIDSGIENKHMYAPFAGGTLNNTTQIALEHLVMPAQGAGVADRLGQQIKVKYVKVNIEARASVAESGVNAQHIQHFRVVILRQNHTDVLAPATVGTNQGIFQTTVAGAGYSTALLNPVTCAHKWDKGSANKFYTILYDSAKELNPLRYGGATANAATTVGDITRFQMRKKFPKGCITNFTAATTGAVTSITDRSYYICVSIGNTAVNDACSYSWSGHYEICYEDA